MDYTIIWTRSALDDLRELVRYIASDDPVAAERFGNSIVQRVEAITNFPRVGRVVPEIGDELIRELIIAPYRIVYELDDAAEQIAVIRVWHGARGTPDLES